ncbi:MAG: nitroreductase family protein [Eubacteriales bacterium]|nr:nitroreductase family protein [Eubacteriales bacterium]
MNKVITCIRDRRAIRRYRPEQIADEALDAVLEAGLYAPSAGGRQSALFLVSQDAAFNQELGKINKNLFQGKAAPGNVSTEQPGIADDASLESGFYGAPTVVTLFDATTSQYAVHNCCVAAENMMLAAHSLGVGSCLVGRAQETFASDAGKALLRHKGISDDYQAVCHVLLGYPIDVPAAGKARKQGRIIRA